MGWFNIWQESEEYAVRQMGIGKRLREWKETITDAGIGISTEGRRQVLLAGCEELLTYEAELVRIRTACGVLVIVGKDLTLRAFHGNRMLVDGEWTHIQWEDAV